MTGMDEQALTALLDACCGKRLRLEVGSTFEHVWLRAYVSETGRGAVGWHGAGATWADAARSVLASMRTEAERRWG